MNLKEEILKKIPRLQDWEAQGLVDHLAARWRSELTEAVAILDEARDSVADCASYEATHESHRPDRAIRTMKTLEKIDAFLDTHKNFPE